MPYVPSPIRFNFSNSLTLLQLPNWRNRKEDIKCCFILAVKVMHWSWVLNYSSNIWELKYPKQDRHQNTIYFVQNISSFLKRLDMTSYFIIIISVLCQYISDYPQINCIFITHFSNVPYILYFNYLKHMPILFPSYVIFQHIVNSCL